MLDMAYRGAAVIAFFLVLCIAAFAQETAQDRLSQDRPGQDRFAQDRSLQDLSRSSERFGRDQSGPDRPNQDRFNQDRFNRDRERPSQGASQGSNHGRGGGNQPGDFEFYVLALSWSPSFCESSRERNQGRRPLQQCEGRPYHFVVHGLWPQYERGFPRDCQVPAPRLSRNVVDTMLDLMPSPRLVFNQWDRHGTCTGMNGQQYFELVRKARENVQIPEQFKDVAKYLMVTPDEVEQAFVDSNPGLSREAIAVTCDTRRLSEVRICMSKDLRFRNCAEVDRRSCRNDKVAMPPARGG